MTDKTRTTRAKNRAMLRRALRAQKQALAAMDTHGAYDYEETWHPSNFLSDNERSAVNRALLGLED